MAEEDVKEAEAGAESKASAKNAPPKGKTKLLLGGGLAATVALGALAAFMALPSKEVKRNYVGPHSLALFEEPFHCNIQEQGRTRFLQMKPVANYLSYDPKYLSVRTMDELFAAELQNTVFRISSRKTLDEIYGEVNESTFMEELRDALDPVLFPVHIGDSRLPWDMDSASKLRPGLSSNKTTFRGRFDEHLLHVDASSGNLWIDDGPKTEFKLGDLDVRVITSEGEVVFIDTSGLIAEFVGDVKIGAQGQVIRIIPVDLMVQ